MSEKFERPAPLSKEQIEQRRAETREQKISTRRMSLFEAQEESHRTHILREVEQEKVKVLSRIADTLDRIAEQLSKR